MHLNIVILIIALIIWLAVEGMLIKRDKKNAMGSTRIDKKTRLFNILATEFSLLSPVLLLLVPSLNLNAYPFALTFAGALLILCGFILRYWAIRVLGKYFRTTIEIDERQPIIQSGPYRYIRHPSYSGIILFFIGYGLLSQNWLSLFICVAFPVIALSYRIKIEERALKEKLGSQYTDYSVKTKKLIPGIW